MKSYIQFLTLSTGYVSGSIPPRFDNSHKKPIEMLGSDGIFQVDGRWCSATVHAVAREQAKNRRAIGYKLCHGLTCNGWQRESRAFLISNEVQV
jgi:hypothetical protein